MIEPVFYHAAAALGFGLDPEADTVVAQGGVVVDAGTRSQMRRDHGTPTTTHRLPGCLLLPGLVNAHTHLELTAIGPQPYGGDFVDWVSMLREHGPGAGQPEGRWLTRAAEHGARAAAAAGVQAVGDIARLDGARDARRRAGLGGTTFIELFGLGPPHDAAALARTLQPADGFQPHAPYSAGPALFEAALASGRPVCTHLAETHDEAQFVAGATGRFRELLERIGRWAPEFADAYQAPVSPVQWMAPHLGRGAWLLAHCNYVDDADIALLAQARASVAYCPVASDYFGHCGHRYQAMLEAGVNVCLGTDSAVCQPPQADPTQWLSVLPQMRHVHRRDGVAPACLLEMATARGRRALGLGDAVTRLCAVRIDPAPGVDPLVAALSSDAPGRGIDLAEEAAAAGG